MAIDLSISIINHSNPEMLRDCLRSLSCSAATSASAPGFRLESGDAGVAATEKPETGSACEIIVIDNATDHRLVHEIQLEFPTVKWIFNKNRLGFSANHNQALSIATGRYLCILNDDTIIHPGALNALVRYLDENPKAGMAGPRTLNRDGSIQNSTFRAKSLFGELIDILQLPGGLNKLKLRGIDPAQHGDQPAAVAWLLGACIVIRRQAMEQVGLLDDVLSPIANCEEVDWCDRVRNSGWDVVFVPGAKITHFGGQSLKSESTGPDRFRIEMHRVTIAYFAKQHGLFSSLLLRGIYIITLPWNGLMLGQSALRGRLKKNEAKATWATLLGIARIALTPLRKPYCRTETRLPDAKSSPLPQPQRTALSV
jgi:GT2 family glycosyltransferase